jgi:hypothetical protein
MYPDLDTEADYWGMEGFWSYAFYAPMIYVRVAAERTDRSVEAVVETLAVRRGSEALEGRGKSGAARARTARITTATAGGLLSGVQETRELRVICE